MTLIRPDLLHLFAHINGAAATVISGGLPDSAVVRNGAGDWTITIPDGTDASPGPGGIDINNCQPVVTVLGGTPLISSVNQTSDTVFQILLEDDAGAATDANFKVTWFKLRTE